MTLFALAFGCSDSDVSQPVVTRQSPLVPLDTGTVRITSDADTFLVSVEIAETRDQQGYGLMERYTLPPDEGMIFVYGAPHDGTFYMYRTKIPLDIAFYDESGAILSIQTMTPCTSPNPSLCQDYGPGAPYVGALEVNADYFAERGITTGDEIVLLGDGSPGGL